MTNRNHIGGSFCSTFCLFQHASYSSLDINSCSLYPHLKQIIPFSLGVSKIDVDPFLTYSFDSKVFLVVDSISENSMFLGIQYILVENSFSSDIALGFGDKT